MKPPQEELDESGEEQHKYYLVYVSNGREVRALCTHAVWKKALGPAPQPGRKLPGYDNKIHHHFFIVSDPKQNDLIVDVDLLPENKYQRGAVPSEQEGLHTMEILINSTSGQIEIVTIPPKVLDSKVMAIMNAIDALEIIEPGQEIAGCEVVAVAGNRIQLEISQV